MIKLLKFLALLALASLACLGTAISTTESTPAPTTTPAPTAGTNTLPAHARADALDIPPTSPARTCASVTAAASLHIRSDADYEAAIIGYLYHAEIVTVTNNTHSPDWWTIRTAGGERSGWARADYLTIIDCPTGE